MSSLPDETLRDAMQPLDRWTLDTVQFSDRHFLQLVTQDMSKVCLRPVESADFEADLGDSRIRVRGLPVLRESWNRDGDYTDFFSVFLNALRSSRVAEISLIGIAFTPALVALVLEAPIKAHELRFDRCTFTELTPTRVNELVVHFSPTALKLSSTHHGGFLQTVSKNRVRRIEFPDMEVNPVTDDAIIEFFVQPGVPGGQDGDAAWPRQPYGELCLNHVRLTKDLFKRLVKANPESLRTQPLRVSATSARVEDEDLRDFCVTYAHHLSYRDRDDLCEMLLFDFLGEPHGEVAAMDLQIAFRPGARWLKIVRARRPDPFFYEPGDGHLTSYN